MAACGMSTLPRVCVIGAGSSGIAAAKALHERGIRRSTASRRPIASAATGCSRTPTACRRRTARCTSTPRASGWRTRTSRCRSRYPDFPHHTHIAALLRRLRRPLRLPRPDHVPRPRVERAERGADGGWSVRLDGGRDAPLRRAARRQRPPLGPALAGARVPGTDVFAGEQMHSHHYTGDDPEQFRDKRVRRARHGQLGDGHRRRGVVHRRRGRSWRRGAARG